MRSESIAQPTSNVNVLLHYRDIHINLAVDLTTIRLRVVDAFEEECPKAEGWLTR
jgi:hypothetical protein